MEVICRYSDLTGDETDETDVSISNGSILRSQMRDNPNKHRGDRSEGGSLIFSAFSKQVELAS